MAQRRKARAPRRSVRRSEKASKQPAIRRGPAPVAGSTAGAPSAAGGEPTIRISEVVYATDAPAPARPTFSDAGLARPAFGDGRIMGGSADFTCFADRPIPTPAVAPPGGDCVSERPAPSRSAVAGVTTWEVDLVDANPGRSAGDGPPKVQVDTYMNLGTEWDYCWRGPVMDRRGDGPVRGHPGEASAVGQVSTETVRTPAHRPSGDRPTK